MLETASLGAESSSPRRTAADDYGDVDLEFVGELFVVLREGDEFDLADGVFEGGLGVEFAGALGLGDLEAGDDAGDGDFVLRVLRRGGRSGGSGFISQAVAVSTTLHVAELLAVLVHRVAGDEEAEDFFFVLQAGVLVPLGDAGERVFGCGCWRG